MSKSKTEIDMPPVYEVHWIDAYVSTDDISIKKARTLKPIATITVGFLVYEGDEGIVLAMDWWPKDPKKMKAYCFIPWGMVVRSFCYA